MATKVKVSAAMMRQLFHSCDPDYVREVCKGRCCESSKGILVTVHPSEKQKFINKGAAIKDGFFVADERGLCPFKTDDGRCMTHDDKPFGCASSPFTLNKNSTLIVRNRYRLLKCYRCHGSKPAYKAHRWSLEQIFGKEEAQRIAMHLDSGGGDLLANMPDDHFNMLHDNDAAKREHK